MQNISLICFDMWNTLCHGGGKKQMEEVQAALKADHIPYGTFLKQVEISLMTHPWSLKQGLTNLSEKLKLPVTKSLINQASEIWLNYVINLKPFPETESVLKKLSSSGIKIAVVSNTDVTSIYQKIKLLGWKKYLNKLFISAELGFLKPDKRVFQSIENHYRLPKSTFLFVDNSLYHGVYPARQFGWQALLIDRSQKISAPGKIKSLTEILDFLKIK